MPKTTFEFRPGFIPEAIFRAYTTLDGSCAAAFLESQGKKVMGFGDIQTNGVAVTEDGWTLSTNGMLGNNPEHHAACVEKLQRLGRIEPKLCAAHGRPFAWPHAVGCTECCRLAAESADSSMAPNGGFWA